jgi:hypothetical protein
VDGSVFWECRSVLEGFFSENTAWDTSRVIKKQMDVVETVCEKLGLKFWGEFIPSAKSYDACKEFYDQQNIETKYIREEFSVSTLGLLVWLLVWTESRRGLDERDQCRAMLHAFFASELDASLFHYDRIVDKYDNEMNNCVLRTTQNMPCRCLRYEMSELTNTQATWDFRPFVTFLNMLLWDTSCLAHAPMGNMMIREVRNAINHSVHGRPAADPLKDASPFVTAAGKRRRIDEDFKRNISKLSTNSDLKPMEACHVTKACSAQGVAKFQLSAVKANREASKDALTCNGVVIIADDSSGHGKPSESTLMSLIWDSETEFMAAGQPMVTTLVFARV